MQKLTIIRGLPGSGKSTLARKISREAKAFHIEADAFFVHAGEYRFDPSRIKDAHAWCQDEARQMLREGLDVVVANTFTQHWEMKPYLDMADQFGADVEIIVCRGEWPNVNGVPQEAINRMRDRWED